jgi:hypothetical protein
MCHRHHHSSNLCRRQQIAYSSVATTTKDSSAVATTTNSSTAAQKDNSHPEKTTTQKKTTSSQSNRAQVSQKKTSSSPFKKLGAPLSCEKTDVELEALMRLDVKKWMASLKKAPPLKRSTKELEVKGKMLRCLAKPKKLMSLDYKCTMQNPHCAKRSAEILENEDEQMLKFYQEAGLSLEQLHDQSKIQMAYVPKAWI